MNPTAYLNESLIGLRIDQRWTILAPLGEGGIGEVYLATDDQLLGRKVVIKILKEDAFQSDYLRNKFKHEMESLIKVRDSGVAAIYGAGALPSGVPYIVMELVEGQSLKTVLSRGGAMPLSEVAYIAQQLGRTLTSAHEAGIIHRDIKPSNIMLCRHERGLKVKLIDFGIARVKDSLVADSTDFSQVAGTWRYMSPEQLLGQNKNLTPASDLYSLGLVVYEMLTGERAFDAVNALHLSRLHEEGVRVMPKDLRPEISVAAQMVLLKALEFEAGKRYQQACEFGDALAQALTRKESSTVPQGTLVAVAPLYNDDELTRDSRSRARLSAGENGNSRLFKAAAAIVLLLAVAGAVLSIALYAARRAHKDAERNVPATSPEPLANAGAGREFSYSLLVTPMKDGKPLQEPFVAAPSESSFLSGWQFRLLFKSHQDGFLYMLNEGLDKNGKTPLRMLFPHPDFNSSSAAIKSGQQVKTSPSAFDSNPGVEKIWLVWASERVPELESVKHLVNEKELGAISDARQSKALQDFLKQHGEPKPVRETDEANKSTTVKSGGGVLVELLELHHN